MSSSKIQKYIAVRAAMRPFCDINKHDQQGDMYLQALYLASHSLYQKYNLQSKATKPIDNNKLLYPLIRYGLRMSTRSTPFGLFAGCGVSFSDYNQTVHINTQQAQFCARLDNLVLHSLAQKISCIPAVKKQLCYLTNSSLYPAHDELRYVEYVLTNKKRNYKISAVADSDSLNSVINFCQSGARWSEIMQMLVEKYAITYKEAENYLQELLASQLLVSELEPAITGEEYLPRVVRLLKKLSKRSDSIAKGSYLSVSQTEVKEVVKVLTLLEDVATRLHQIEQRASSITEQGPAIVNQLRSWLPDITENKLLQIDMIFSATNQAVNVAATPDPFSDNQNAVLYKVIDVLNKLTPNAPHQSLSTFANQFYRRFEDQEVPLAVALDTDTGINYLEQAEQALSPILEELTLPLPPKKDVLTWDKHQIWKWKLLQDTLRQQQPTSLPQETKVNITDDILMNFAASEDNLPPSISIMFRKVAGGLLYLDSVGGVSATNLLNRFAHADPAIHKVVKDICEQEQGYNPDVVFAEIVHLPESRVGNVTFHPTSRSYEIPYLAASSVDADHQLPIADLYVSVVNGRIILRSKKLNKRIIPRLSTAHNYRFSELPVYRFLCDMQIQGLRSDLSFSWCEPFGRFKFVPRVTYQNVVLHPATWYFEETDFASLKGAKQPSDFFSAYQSFCKQWNLPQQWVHADRDNELFVDSEQLLTVEAWWDLAKSRKLITIKEFFAPAEGAVVNERGETHAHQLVATWIKQKPTYQGIAPRSVTSHPVTRTFIPGSEWTYYKVYAGEASQDRLLEEIIGPLTQQWQEEQTVKQWFFIRYADPDPHLRLRFHLTDNAYFTEIVQQFSTALDDFIVSGLVTKLQLDTYQRELERYGGAAISQAETLFHHDSEATLHFLELTEGDDREDLRWLWGLRSIHELLNDFNLTISEKLGLLQNMKESFAQEFKINKPLKLQLDKKYRVHRSAIHDMLMLQDVTDEFYSLVRILQNRSTHHASAVAAILKAHQASELPLPLTDLLRSYIHMLVNRLIPSQARFHELVIYDFLYRHYRSDVAKGQKSKGSSKGQ